MAQIVRVLSRRDWFNQCSYLVMRWTPWLGLLGFSFHRYSFGPAGGYVGWIEFLGRTIAFVPCGVK